MRLKTVVKLGTVISVLLFALAIGYYAFTRLDMAEDNRDVNLYHLVPSCSIGVLDTDNIHAFLNEHPDWNYSHELTGFQFPGLFNFLVNGLNEYMSDAHGLSNRMSRLLVSFHHPGTSRDQVVYFRMGMEDEQLLADMLQEYMPGNFLPKEEEYRGKTMRIYPLSNEDFLTVFVEKGLVVLSYQKRLIEEVVDALLDETALGNDRVFAEILPKKKSQNFLRLYGRSASMPFLNMGQECWSEYDFHMNSDVVYLTGDTYAPEVSDCMGHVSERLSEVPVVREDGLLISAEKDSTALFMNLAFEANDKGMWTLFNECVANLSNEASFSLVADMRKVEEEPGRFQAYLPAFVLNNAALFRSFILSAQLSLHGERPSHIWVFTYKD